MAKDLELIGSAKKFAVTILKNDISKDLVYHSLEHTEGVVAASQEIGKESGLEEDQLEVLELAAWFHDLGYRDTIQNHEEHSIEIADQYLTDARYDNKKKDQVLGCIRATKMPQQPQNNVEQVLCDADLSHLGKDDFFEKSQLLLEELNTVGDELITESKWLEMNKEFILGHTYFTDYAKDKFNPAKEKNLKQVKKELKKASKKDKQIESLEENILKLKEKVEKTKQLKPDRGIETMFRLTSKNHLQLSAMADTKANIMISINSIILSILMSVLYRKLEEYPHMVVPALILTVVCLVTIVFSILATRPNVSSGKFTRDNIINKETNLLFFGNFHAMRLPDYEWGMKQMLKDADYLYTSLIRDIYFLGVVLGKKYRLLRTSYTIFMFGFVIAVLSFIIAETFFKSPYPY